MPLTAEELAAQKLESDRVAVEAATKKAADEDAKAKELESIPESLRGKTPKELSDMLLEASLESEKHKRTAGEKEAELERLRPGKTQELSEGEKKALREREFITDPTAFLDKHVSERLQPLTEGYFKDKAETVFSMAKRDKDSYPEFAKYEKGIKAILETVPIEVRSNPASIDLAYKMIRYPELEKQIKEAAARGGLHNEGVGSPKLPPAKSEPLSEDEKSVAKRFGMTEEQYIESRDKRGLE